MSKLKFEKSYYLVLQSYLSERQRTETRAKSKNYLRQDPVSPNHHQSGNLESHYKALLKPLTEWALNGPVTLLAHSVIATEKSGLISKASTSKIRSDFLNSMALQAIREIGLKLALHNAAIRFLSEYCHCEMGMEWTVNGRGTLLVHSLFEGTNYNLNSRSSPKLNPPDFFNSMALQPYLAS